MESANKKKLLILSLVLILALIIAGSAWYFLKKSSQTKVSTETKTEAKKDEACRNYTDCGKGLYCKESVCAVPAESSTYFDKVVTSKADPLLPADQTNSMTVATTFTTADELKIDFVGVKATTLGVYYIELAKSDNREIALTTRHLEEKKLEGKDTSTTIDLTRIEPGKYDLNVYLSNELIYTTPISVD